MKYIPKILIVDDEITNLKYVASLLESSYEIKVTNNPLTALDILKKIEIDLILLDIHMPQMNGYELAEILQENIETKNIPIIFLTADKDNNSLVQGFDYGAKDYITKPFNKKELLVRVRNHVKSYLMEKELQKQQEFVESILNLQSNMVLLTDSINILFVNKPFLEFFECKDIYEFIKKYKDISEIFIEDETCFHLGKLSDKTNWLKHLKGISNKEKIVSFFSNKHKEIRFFNLLITNYNEKDLITFIDITDSLREQEKLKNKLLKDKLTNTYNREYLYSNIDSIIHKTKEENKKLCIAFFDIDFFKHINDTYGHDEGDKVLINFVECIKKYSRKDDILVRWGGEEFILILKINFNSDLNGILEKLRIGVEEEKFDINEQIKCSIGATNFLSNEDINDTIKRADQALYESKRAGRNKITII